MATANKKSELEIEREIKRLTKIMEAKGVKVRREKLARGHSFKVKSGACELTGQEHVFIDKRLSNEIQVAILLDAFVERKLCLEASELQELSVRSRSLLSGLSAT